MTTVFVSHPSDKLEPYFGAKALAALEAIADVRINPEARELSTPELIDAMDACDVLCARHAGKRWLRASRRRVDHRNARRPRPWHREQHCSPHCNRLGSAAARSTSAARPTRCRTRNSRAIRS